MIITKTNADLSEFTADERRRIRDDWETLRALTAGRKGVRHASFPNRKIRRLFLETVGKDGAHVTVYALRSGFVVKDEHSDRETSWTAYEFKQAA